MGHSSDEKEAEPDIGADVGAAFRRGSLATIGKQAKLGSGFKIPEDILDVSKEVCVRIC
jgi:hypothetical protein